jgi:hypothetical protein
VVNDYIVEVHDEAGLFTEFGVEDWASCLRVVRDLAKRYPQKQVSAYNATHCEVDTDGLSDDERDALVVAVDEGMERGR